MVFMTNIIIIKCDYVKYYILYITTGYDGQGQPYRRETLSGYGGKPKALELAGELTPEPGGAVAYTYKTGAGSA